jgi:uncharacterized membrane protein
VRILLLGAATGLRSMAAPSQLSRRVRRDRSTAHAPGRWIGGPAVYRLLQLAAIGEMIVDKLPTTPDRIAPGPLAGRVVLGSASGAQAARLEGTSSVRGALLGAVGAAAGAYAGYHARRWLVRRAGLPDVAVALCEDVVAILLARGALTRQPTADAEPSASRRQRR